MLVWGCVAIIIGLAKGYQSPFVARFVVCCLCLRVVLLHCCPCFWIGRGRRSWVSFWLPELLFRGLVWFAQMRETHGGLASFRGAVFLSGGGGGGGNGAKKPCWAWYRGIADGSGCIFATGGFGWVCPREALGLGGAA